MSDPISLRVAVLQPVDVEYFHNIAGYRVRLEVIEAVGMPEQVFVHRVSRHVDGGAEFYGIAGPYDLVTMPDVSTGVPGDKFRANQADFLITSVNVYDETVRHVDEGLRNLVTSLIKLSQLSQTQELSH